MFRKILAVALMSAATLTSAAADDSTRFYAKEIPRWYVYGITSESGSRCWARSDYADGSQFAIIQPFGKENFDILIRNVDWDIQVESGTTDSARMNLISKKNVFFGQQFGIVATDDKDMIHIPEMKPTMYNFLGKAAAIQMVMPGKMKNFSAPLENIQAALKELGTCLKSKGGKPVSKKNQFEM